MLHIWILNVGHGDSIVLRYRGPDGDAYAVIDSNRHNGTVPALDKLNELGAKDLSFVALTHPHADHFAGMPEILRAYKGRIGHFYTFPIANHAIPRLQRLQGLAKELHQSSDSPTIKKRTLDFVAVLHAAGRFASNDSWEEIAGHEAVLHPAGFNGVKLAGLLPPAKVKGPYFQAIIEGDTSMMFERALENDLSIALQVVYGSTSIVLGGDGTHSNWLNHRRAWDRSGAKLHSRIVKLPHHGSKHECRADVIDHLFAPDGDRIALISANGRTHPHDETYVALNARGIAPYCTNLATQCGANLRSLPNLPQASAVLRRAINSFGEPVDGQSQPCQGDILVEIDGSGGVKVTTQYGALCPYRDLPQLFPAA